MALSDVAIKRPVFMTMVTVGLVVIGLLGFSRMSMELFPRVDFPVVLVNTIYPGAGPEQVETQVTMVIEEAVNSISGIKTISSTSQEAISQVVIQFDLDIASVNAAQDVREKIALIKNKLPTDVKDPTVLRIDPGAAPIMSMVASSDQLDNQSLTEYIKDIIKPRFESSEGVGQVNLLGGSDRQINIFVNLQKLNAYGLSISEVGQKIGSGNLEFPGGRINEGQRELLVRTTGRFKSVKEMENLVIKNVGTQFVRLRDIAEVVDGTVEARSYSAYNGNSAIGLSIVKQSDANTVEAATVVKKVLNELQPIAKAAGVSLTLVDDTSIFIKQSVAAVEEDMIIGGILAVVIIFFFLANGASTFISALALPTSIIATFGFMYFMGFTLNFMTLLALSLSVGILIDDAIVVIENIYRHLDVGESKVHAAARGTKEIALAVMATTFSIVAVFFPVATMEGIVGRFFFPFGITVSIAVLVSLFVAFTLTPMLAARMLSKETHLTKESPWYLQPLYYFNHAFDLLNVFYRRVLDWSLNHKISILLLATVAFFGSFYFAGQLGSEFVPQQDQGRFTVTMKAPPGTSLEQTIIYANQVERQLKTYPEVVNTFITIGDQNQPVNMANILVLLKPKKERSIDAFNLIYKIRNEQKSLSGISLWYGLPSNVGPPQKPLQISVQGPDFAVSEKLSKQVLDIYKRTPGMVDLESSLEESKPEIQISLKRDVATEAGINMMAVASTIQNLIDGVKVSDFQDGNNQYEVRVRLREADRKNLNQLNQVMIKSTKKDAFGADMMIPLSSIAEIKEGYTPSKITRYNRQRQILLSANLAGTLLGNASTAVGEEIKKMEIPDGYSVGAIGQAEQQKESFGNIFIALILAVVFVYLILASQFESFVQPIAIMVSLPLSLIGAFIGLWAFNSSISIMSLIGIIMLFGLVTKNAILLVDFTNQLRAEGYSRFDALMRAGPIRLRPILMTTFAMIFGMLPVALAVSEGSESRAPLGQAIIGGLITSTVLTLIVVPVVYTLLDSLSTWFKNKLGFSKWKLDAKEIEKATTNELKS